MFQKRIKEIEATLKQYEEGAITYIQFVQWVMSQTTPQDVLDHTKFDESIDKRDSMKGWPFD